MRVFSLLQGVLGALVVVFTGCEVAADALAQQRAMVDETVALYGTTTKRLLYPIKKIKSVYGIVDSTGRRVDYKEGSITFRMVKVYAARPVRRSMTSTTTSRPTSRMASSHGLIHRATRLSRCSCRCSSITSLIFRWSTSRHWHRVRSTGALYWVGIVLPAVQIRFPAVCVLALTIVGSV